jgi:hypothetical protein
MGGTLSELKHTLGIGGRTNKYKVVMNGKTNVDNFTVNTFVKSATIPGRSFADVEVHVQGRLITIAGDAQYDGTWTLTFLDTEQHTLRKQFLAWMNYIDEFESHKRGVNTANDYMTESTIHQLSTIDNTPTASYTLYNVYPKSISEISYSDENSSMIEFSVEFNYSHWVES